MLNWAGNLLDSVDSQAAETIHKLEKSNEVFKSNNIADNEDDKKNGQKSVENSDDNDQINDDDVEHQNLVSTPTEKNSLSGVTTALDQSDDDIALRPSIEAVPEQLKETMSPRSTVLSPSNFELRLRTKDEEISSLTSVWNQTREELQKVKSILRKRDEKYRFTASKLRSDLKTEANELEAIQRARADKFETDLKESRQECADISSSRDVERQAMRTELDALKRQVKQQENLVIELQSKQHQSEEERSAMLRQHERIEAEHARRVRALIDEYDERLENAQQQEHSAHKRTDSRTHLQERETEFAVEKQAYAHALSQSQRRVEATLANVKKLDAKCLELSLSKQNSEASNERLMQQLTHAQQAQEDLEMQTNLKIQEAHTLVETAENRTRDEAEKARQSNALVEQLQRQINAKDDSVLQTHINTLESRLKGMANHLLTRQEEVERSASVVSSLRLQLEQTQCEVKTLRADTRRNYDESDDFIHYDNENHQEDFVESEVERGDTRLLRYRGGEATNTNRYRWKKHNDINKTRKKPSAIMQTYRMVDNFGARFGVVLRRYPKARLFSFIYIALLHSFVLLVLSHFLHHESRGEVSMGGIEGDISPNLHPNMVLPPGNI